MNVVITGGHGFLGWHTACRLRALGGIEPVRLGRAETADADRLRDEMAVADVLIHLAGVNRAESDEAVRQGNIDLAIQLADAVIASDRPVRIVYANSIQAELDNPYGRGKAEAATVLSKAAAQVGGSLADVMLPNVFGEHGRPHYNSFVATFCHLLAGGGAPTVRDDKAVPLLHAQAAAQVLMDAMDGAGDEQVRPAWDSRTVSGVLAQLQTFHALYTYGEIPELTEPFAVDLFNTYRSYAFPQQFPFHPQVHADPRGELFETVRSHGGTGQAFVSTTRPGFTRGDHYHLHKVERFFVVRGRAEIRLRRLLDDEVVTFRLDGSRPGFVDMPTMWVHNITNVGDEDLVTMFWADQLLDPDNPDQIPERVIQGGLGVKVMTIVGTRPEIIRLSRVIARLDQSVDHVLVHTGQNYDYTLNQVFFEDLELRQPDHFLEVDTSSLGRVLGETLIRSEEVMRAEQPDAVLVLGDTNSSIAAVMAKRMLIPTYHMEAGNRCFDENVPEETNRRLVDHVADFNLVYTEHARRNLLAEGLHPRRILLTGSPMREVLEHFRERIDASDALTRLGLEAGHYFLVSAHREENVDSPARLTMLLDCLTAVHATWGHRIVVSTHPRTRKRLEALDSFSGIHGIDFMEPFGFHDYNRLQTQAACVLSDSGTISEESSILGFPAVTLRDSIERPEALDTGAIVMTGLDRHDVVAAVEMVTRDFATTAPDNLPAGYEVLNTSVRTQRFILSTAGRHRQWAGIRT